MRTIHRPKNSMNRAQDALQRLKDGNRRFVSGTTQLDAQARARAPISDKPQEPFAVILGCSDSRVPAEIVFDQSLGDLFVIRIAGNIVAPSQIGSVEFAVEAFGTRLVVVLGHSECGAVDATLGELTREQAHRSPNLRSIVDHIKPALEPLVAEFANNEDSAALMTRAVRANVDRSVERLHSQSEVIARFVKDDGLMIVGAEYSLAERTVTFFDRHADLH